MKEKMKAVFIALLLTLFSLIFFYCCFADTTLLLFRVVPLSGWLLDLYLFCMGILFACGAIMIWKQILTKK